MKTDDFNLIYEPWIRVHSLDGSAKEVSILELFQHAHDYQSLAGDMPTQDVSILRLLLAILHTVFSRVNAEGLDEPLGDLTKKEILGRWQELWERGAFPVKPIEEYLRRMENRFQLFDEVHPFYQFPAAKRIAGLDGNHTLKCKATKLNASINQSDNKRRIFLDRAGENLRTLSYAEAARWLITMVHCDCISVKESNESKKRAKANTPVSKETAGVGWLGKLGIVYAEGDNLFETLMLNFVLWPNGEYVPPEEEVPIWERDEAFALEREFVPWPENMAALLTFPSRYILLERENGAVAGGYPLFGPYFDRESPAAFLEQMTLRNGKKNPKKSAYYPEPHPKNAFLWQEFEPVLVGGEYESDSRPGVVRWIGMLQNKSKLKRDRLVRFTSVGIYYEGQQRSLIEQVQSDTLSLHANLLSELALDWRKMITEEVVYTEKIARQVGWLAQDLEIAACGVPLKKGKIDRTSQMLAASDRAISAFYRAMDLPFRQWLCSISAQDQDREKKRSQWRALVRREARELGSALAHRAGPAAYRGHTITEDGKSPMVYATPALYGRFCARLEN